MPVERKTKLLSTAIKRVQALPPERQNAIAEVILAELQNEPDPATARFQQLIQTKYTKGLTAHEAAELKTIEASFYATDELFYRPILDRVERKLASGKS